jgi:hypothetical protein
MNILIALALLAQDGLTVHEWGTFTTVSGSDGATLEWRPLAGSSDLPSFVYQIGGEARGLRHGKPCKGCRHVNCACGDNCKPVNGQCQCKSCYEATVRMETPVLYFYADRETTVSVKVGFPRGKITEWYPQAREVKDGIDWGGIKVLPGARVEFPRESAESHYYPARETDAAPVRVCGNKIEHEKFLFYRGVGTFDLPLRATLEGDLVVLEPSMPISTCIVFRREGKELSYAVRKNVTGRTTVDRYDGPPGRLEEELEKALTAEGLYGKEARAMVRTWRDSWFEDGVRVFYAVPRKITDAVLPIEIDPKPAELVRVLVGRLEILTPGMEAEIRRLVERLGEKSIDARDEATAALRKYGRFAEPLLKRVLAQTSDPEIQARVRSLLELQ